MRSSAPPLWPPCALDPLLEALDRAAIEAEEAESALSAAEDALHAEPGKLEAVEERLFALRAAARKHRTDPDSLVPLLATLREQLDLIESGAHRLAERAAATETVATGLSRQGRGHEPLTSGRGGETG